jgi:uncharacterized membrane protein
MDKDEVIDKETTGILFEVATWLTMIGTGIMIIAFVTDTYAVLVLSLELAISTCLIGISFFFLVYLVFRSIDKDLRNEI